MASFLWSDRLSHKLVENNFLFSGYTYMPIQISHETFTDFSNFFRYDYILFFFLGPNKTKINTIAIPNIDFMDNGSSNTNIVICLSAARYVGTFHAKQISHIGCFENHSRFRHFMARFFAHSFLFASSYILHLNYISFVATNLQLFRRRFEITFTPKYARWEKPQNSRH